MNVALSNQSNDWMMFFLIRRCEMYEISYIVKCDTCGGEINIHTDQYRSVTQDHKTHYYHIAECPQSQQLQLVLQAAREVHWRKIK